MLKTLGRFILRPGAYVRYWGWLVAWHIEQKREWSDTLNKKTWTYRWWFHRDYSTQQWKPKYPIPFWVASRIKRCALKVRGSKYSHRSDFTDREVGILHGGNGWSKEAFDTFLKRISIS